MTDTYTEAVEALCWAQRSLDTQAANRAGYGDPELADAVATPVAESGIASVGARPNALARWKDGMGYGVRLGDDWPLLSTAPPSLLVSLTYDELVAERPGGLDWRTLHPSTTGRRNRVWRGTTFESRVDDPANQPRGPLLDAGALVSADRVHRVAVLGDLADVPVIPDGTHALVIAAYACEHVATALDISAGWFGVATARRYRTEAEAYREHAAACVGALSSSLGWLGRFERELDPIPPFAPVTVPAQLRGYVVISPI